ncbi:hypothetical protein BD779DRAFT_1719315 [Infundibulicybe gibba]|nr:hypothetical protein BD779DRAFT_1719315 [Infundibulicybe gibba]
MKGTKMRTTNSQMHPPREHYRDDKRASALKLAIHTGDGELVVGERGWKSYLTQEEAQGVSLELGRPGGVCGVSGEVAVAGKRGASVEYSGSSRKCELVDGSRLWACRWHFGSGRHVGSARSGGGGGEAWNVVRTAARRWALMDRHAGGLTWAFSTSATLTTRTATARRGPDVAAALKRYICTSPWPLTLSPLTSTRIPLQELSRRGQDKRVPLQRVALPSQTSQQRSPASRLSPLTSSRIPLQELSTARTGQTHSSPECRSPLPDISTALARFPAFSIIITLAPICSRSLRPMPPLAHAAPPTPPVHPPACASAHLCPTPTTILPDPQEMLLSRHPVIVGRYQSPHDRKPTSCTHLPRDDGAVTRNAGVVTPAPGGNRDGLGRNRAATPRPQHIKVRTPVTPARWPPLPNSQHPHPHAAHLGTRGARSASLPAIKVFLMEMGNLKPTASYSNQYYCAALNILAEYNLRHFKAARKYHSHLHRRRTEPNRPESIPDELADIEANLQICREAVAYVGLHVDL